VWGTISLWGLRGGGLEQRSPKLIRVLKAYLKKISPDDVRSDVEQKGKRGTFKGLQKKLAWVGNVSEETLGKSGNKSLLGKGEEGRLRLAPVSRRVTTF